MHGEVPRSLASRGNVTEWLEGLAGPAETEHGDAVVTAIGHGDVPAIRMNADLRCDRLALEVGRQGGPGPKPRQPPVRRVDAERHDRRVQLTHQEPHRLVGVERKMPRPRPSVEGKLIFQFEQVRATASTMHILADAIRAEVGGIDRVTAWAGHSKLPQRQATKPSSWAMGPPQDGHW